MSETGFERIADGAYFVIELSSFTSSVETYDPRIATQTLSSQPQPAITDDEERGEDSVSPPLP